MSSHHNSVAPSLQRVAAVGVLAFFASLFVVRSGHSWAAAVLLLAGLWMLASRPALMLTREDRVLLWTLAAYGVVMIAMTLWLGNRPREMEHPARALLAIPIFLLLLRAPVRQTVLWAGMLAGAALSAVQSWWDLYVRHLGRAAGYLNPIHFGEYALVFAACCVAGLVWTGTQGRHAGKWRVALVLGMLCGLYGMVLSGSRGAWVTLPVLMVVLAAGMVRTRRHLTVAALLVALGAALLAALSTSSDSMLRQRYAHAVDDVAEYRENHGGTSVGARFEMWRAAAIQLQRRPVSGWNMGDYGQSLDNLIQEGRVQPIVSGFKDNLHNTFIHAWVFFGLPGLLVLLALFGVPLWYFARKLRDVNPVVRGTALCGTLFIVSYLCFSLTQSMLMHSSGIGFFLLMLAILWSALRHARTEQADAA